MSTTIEPSIEIGPKSGRAEDNYRGGVQDYCQSTTVANIAGPTKSKERMTGKKPPERRMRGYVTGFNGPEARVVLVHEGVRYEYDLSAQMLRAAGVDQPNQPFELDETAFSDSNGYTVSYTVRPLAKTSFVEELSLSSDQQAFLEKLKANDRQREG